MSELTVSDDGEFRGSMPVGPWLEVEGRTPAGAVAVLVDDLLGYAIVADLPRGHWSVSAEITLDVLRPLPTSGRVFANARLVHADALGGYATGTVTDEDGLLLATTSQRGRYLVAPDGLVEEGAWGGPPAPGDLERLLAARADEPVATTDVHANESGNLHGGVSMFLADLVASALRPDLVTASVHIAYTRGIPIGAAARLPGEHPPRRPVPGRHRRRRHGRRPGRHHRPRRPPPAARLTPIRLRIHATFAARRRRRIGVVSRRGTGSAGAPGLAPRASRRRRRTTRPARAAGTGRGAAGWRSRSSPPRGRP